MPSAEIKQKFEIAMIIVRITGELIQCYPARSTAEAMVQESQLCEGLVAPFQPIRISIDVDAQLEQSYGECRGWCGWCKSEEGAGDPRPFDISNQDTL